MRADSATENLLAAVGLSGLFAIVQDTLDPSGWLWTGTRILGFVLFVVLLATAVIAFVRTRRSRSHPEPN
jgi:hypothetical protein